MKLTTIAYRNLSRNRRRTFLSAIAIALAAVCFVFMFSLIDGLTADMRHNLTTYYTGEIRVQNRQLAEDEELNPLFYSIENADKALAAAEKNLPKAQFSPRINFPAMLYLGEDEDTPFVMGQAVDLEREASFQKLPDLLTAASQMPKMGQKEALMGLGLARKHGFNLGDDVSMMVQTRSRGTNMIALKIVGFLEYPLPDLNNRMVMMPLDLGQRYLRMNNRVSEILIKTDASQNPQSLIADLEKDLGQVNSEVKAQFWQDISFMYNMMQMANMSYLTMSIIFFLLGSTVIVNTIMMVIFERIKEIGTLAAMGMTGKRIVRLFFLEAAIVAVIGSFIGVALGIGITLPLSIVGIDFSSAMGSMDMQINPVYHPLLTLKSTVGVFALSTLVACAASWFPSRRVAAVNPIDALRNE